MFGTGMYIFNFEHDSFSKRQRTIEIQRQRTMETEKNLNNTTGS